MKKRKVIYYTDPLNDEFSKAQITPKVIDGSYVYCHDSAWKRFTHLFWYRGIFTLPAILYTKLVFGQRTVGGEKLKLYRKQGYFLYGNHTQDLGDAFLPNTLNLPKHNYIIVHPNNVSMPVLGRLTPSLGALPLPDDMAANRNFVGAVERRIREGHCVVIYPEAHIWPYYTGIRPFSDASFIYPIKWNTPVFCFTNTYQKRKHRKRPRIVTYVDGPFFPDESLGPRDRRRVLRDTVYETMRERAKASNAVVIQYLPQSQEASYD